jgi:hypothetical protein
MLMAGGWPDRRSVALRRLRKRSPSWRCLRYALRDEEAYLQPDEDEKPEIVAEPPPDPALFRCSFCRKTDRRLLFGAEYPVRDPNTFAVIALVSICDECVAEFAERLAQESLEGPPPH